MRIIHTADWHVGKLLCDYSLLEDQRYWFDRFIEQLTEIKPDALIVAGDIYDRSIPPAEAVSLLDDVLSRITLDLKIPTFIISGNHDSRERLSFGTGLLAKNELYIEGNICERIRCIKAIDGLYMHMLPYFELHHLKRFFPDCRTFSEASARYITAISPVPNAVNILIGHGFFCVSSAENDDDVAGESVGGSQMINLSELANFDYVALGHIHAPRAIGHGHMRYAGSPLKYSIDEASQHKSFTLIDINNGNGNVNISEHTIEPMRDVRVLKGSFEWLSNPDNHSNREDYIFADITDSDYQLGAMQTLKLVFPNILGLCYSEVKTDSLVSLPQSNVQSTDNPALFAEFFEQAIGQPLNTEQSAIVQDTFDSLMRAHI